MVRYFHASFISCRLFEMCVEFQNLLQIFNPNKKTFQSSKLQLVIILCQFCDQRPHLNRTRKNANALSSALNCCYWTGYRSDYLFSSPSGASANRIIYCTVMQIKRTVSYSFNYRDASKRGASRSLLLPSVGWCGWPGEVGWEVCFRINIFVLFSPKDLPQLERACASVPSWWRQSEKYSFWWNCTNCRFSSR